MSQYDDDDLYDDDDEPRGSGGESNVVRELRKQLKATKRELSDLKPQLEQFQRETRKQTITSVLEAKGVNPKVAGLIPADVEATSEAVTKWVDDYAEIFGIATPDTGSQAPAGMDAGQVQALNQMQQATANAMTPTAASDQERQIQDATSIEDLNRLIYAAQSQG